MPTDAVVHPRMPPMNKDTETTLRWTHKNRPSASNLEMLLTTLVQRSGQSFVVSHIMLYYMVLYLLYLIILSTGSGRESDLPEATEAIEPGLRAKKPRAAVTTQGSAAVATLVQSSCLPKRQGFGDFQKSRGSSCRPQIVGLLFWGQPQRGAPMSRNSHLVISEASGVGVRVLG